LSKKTGVLIHGLNVNLQDWERVVWGEPPNTHGRVVRGVATALEQDAEVLVFGTGATERDGKLEAVYTRDYLLEHFDKLEGFALFKGVDFRAARKKILDILVAETRSKNTYQEVEQAAEIFLANGVEIPIHISSAAHMPRCIANACTVYRRDNRFATLAENVCGVVSNVSYGKYAPENVAIVEPPYPGTSESELYALVSQIFDISSDNRLEFDERFKALISEFTVKKVPA